MGNGAADGAGRTVDPVDLLRDVRQELQLAREELAGAARDLERHRNDQHRLETLVDVVLSTTGDAVVVIGDDLKVEGWSRRAEALFDAPQPKALTASFDSLLDGSAADTLDALRDAVAGRGAPTHVELPVRGDQVRFRVSVVADPEDRQHRVVLVEA